MDNLIINLKKINLDLLYTCFKKASGFCVDQAGQFQRDRTGGGFSKGRRNLFENKRLIKAFSGQVVIFWYFLYSRPKSVGALRSQKRQGKFIFTAFWLWARAYVAALV